MILTYVITEYEEHDLNGWHNDIKILLSLFFKKIILEINALNHRECTAL